MINKNTNKNDKESVSLNTDSENITPCRNINNDKLTRYITPYQNIFDNSVSTTKFDVSYNPIIQQITNDKLGCNFTDHESNITNIKKFLNNL